jgi:GT2 family glycosyltransferase
MTETVTVILVHHRTPELLLRCAESVDVPDARLLVIDNASDDGSVACLRARGLEVIEMPTNAGFAAGVNRGMRASKGAFAVVLNPDVTCRPGALVRLIRELDTHPRAAVAAPRIIGRRGRAEATAYRRFPGAGIVALELSFAAAHVAARLPRLHPYRVPPSRWRQPGAVAHVQGAAMALRRAAWEETGGLDERFFLYFEETEWQARLHETGWTIRIVPDAVVDHAGRSGADDRAPAFEFVRSAARYLELRGVAPPVARATISAALLTSRATTAAFARVAGSERWRDEARQWRELCQGWHDWLRRGGER